MAALRSRVGAKVEALVCLLNTKALRIVQTYVVGSYAQGRQTEGSDIDLALVPNQFEGDFFKDLCKLRPVVTKTDTDIETRPFSPTDFTKDDPFVKEIMETGIRIV